MRTSAATSVGSHVEHGLARHLAVQQRLEGRARLAPVGLERDLRIELAGGHEVGERAQVAGARLVARQLAEDHEAVHTGAGRAPVEVGGLVVDRVARGVAECDQRAIGRDAFVGRGQRRPADRLQDQVELLALGLEGVDQLVGSQRAQALGAVAGRDAGHVRAGAHVTGVASGDRAEGLRELGADELIDSFEPQGEEFDLILEAVGGASLSAAYKRVAADGTLVTFGDSSGDPVDYKASDFYGRAAGARVYGFMVFRELARHQSGTRDLRTLADLVAAGELDPQIALEADWREPGPALQALLDRQVAGKAVLHVGAD